jgi:hypothetical protein
MIERGEAVPAIPREWNCPVVLAQGKTSHCCGFSAAGYKAAAQQGAPPDATITDAEGHRLYYECKKIDGDPTGEDGSYIRSVAKVLKNEGVIDAYAFGNFAEADAWVQTYGPVILGTDWTSAMFHPQGGVIAPSGDVAGGHAYLWRGDKQGPADNLIHNSWGRSWGLNGTAYISDADLELLVDKRGGEAMMAVKLVSKPWSDWPDEQLDAAKLIKSTGAMQGYPDGSFRPWDKLTYRHVALIARRVGLSYPREWLDDYACPATRAAVRDTFPFVWLEERWTETITRYQLALLLARYLKERQ